MAKSGGTYCMSKSTHTSNHFKYTQLYEILVEKITSGEWKPNDCMPTERELCERYNLSRITVRDALNLLATDGYIYRRQGKGTFVAVRPIEQKLTKMYSLRENIESKGMVSSIKVLSFKKITAAGKVRETLQLDKGDTAYELIRCLYADNIPYAVETTYIPTALYPEMTAELIRSKGLYKTMQSFNIIPERAIEKLTTVPINREDALLLNVKPLDIAIRDERTTFSQSHIIEFTITTIKSDFFFYTIELN